MYYKSRSTLMHILTVTPLPFDPFSSISNSSIKQLFIMIEVNTSEDRSRLRKYLNLVKKMSTSSLIRFFLFFFYVEKIFIDTTFLGRGRGSSAGFLLAKNSTVAHPGMQEPRRKLKTASTSCMFFTSVRQNYIVYPCMF